MTYTESAALMIDPDFRARVKVACLTFAEYIMIEPSETPAHNTRFKWAASCMVNPDTTASQVTPPTVMGPGVQAAGPEISDEALQTAVETTVSKLI
jgi:hypothetical protein